MTTKTFQPLLSTEMPRLLLVEDDQANMRTYTRILEGHYQITKAANGLIATTILQDQSFDVILSDIRMPGISGVELLRLIRTYDLEVPVLLMTALPELESAIQAVDLGAIGYLVKPFDNGDLERRLAKAVTLSTFARTKREALELQPSVPPTQGVNSIIDRAGLLVRLESALSKIYLVFQPIISSKERRIVAYEALMRSHEPTLTTPLAILETAERIDAISDVTKRVVALVGEAFPRVPEGASMFVNIHASDLCGDYLTGDCPMMPFSTRVVLEITERGSLDGVPRRAECAARLRQAGYQLAVDDLGAGYAGLTTFASVEPEIVKIDMAIIRGIDTSVVRQRIVHSLVHLCRELNMQVVAEGIETQQELAMVTELGCDLLQGYYLGRPSTSLSATFTPW